MATTKTTTTMITIRPRRSLSEPRGGYWYCRVDNADADAVDVAVAVADAVVEMEMELELFRCVQMNERKTPMLATHRCRRWR